MKHIPLSDISSADLTGPHPGPEGDLFRSDRGFEVLLRDHGSFPELELRASGGTGVRVLDEDGAEVGEEALSTLLWERLESFDEVIERLAGPLPDPS
jgi:hypothetical protein